MTLRSDPIAVPLAAQSTVASSAREGSRWLVSRGVDTFVVLGGATAVSLLLYTSARTGAALALAGALFAMLTDMPHVLQTTLRVGLDRRERALHGRRYLVSLAAIAAGTGALFVTGHRPFVAMVWIVWQFFHVIKQHYGISRIYAAKTGYRGPFRLFTAVLLLGCVTPLAYRLGQGMRFNEYVLFGQRMPFSGLGLPDLPVPRPLVVAMYAAAVVAGVLFAREQLKRRARAEQGLPWIVYATLGLALVSYNLSYLFVEDLYALIMIAAAVHSLQYHAISWRRNHERFARAEAERSTFLAILSRKQNVLWYFAVMILFGATVASTETMWLGYLPFVIVLHHFYMDGYVWRSALNPTLAADLGMAPRVQLAAHGAR